MEAFIASYLRDTFDLWLKNFDPKRDMSVRTMKGEATLNNMQMNDEVVRELVGFESLEVTRLNVSSCVINVSPTKLTSAPTLVELGSIDIVLTELETPKALPKVYEQLVAKQQGSAAKTEEYGLREKIVDGARITANHIQIVIHPKPLRNAYDTTDWAPPLLVITVRDFVLQQTDSNWNLVSDLKNARKHNQHPDYVHVFRQATGSVSVHLVPYGNNPGETAAALLRGAKFESFHSKLDAAGGAGASALGATPVIKDHPINLRLILQRRTRDNATLNVQLDVLLPKLSLRVTPRDQALIEDFLLAWDRILSRAKLLAEAAEAAAKVKAEAKAAAAKAQLAARPQIQPPAHEKQRLGIPTTASAAASALAAAAASATKPKPPAVPSQQSARGAKPAQQQMLRPPTVTSRLMLLFGAEDDPTKPKPGVVLHINVAKVIVDLYGMSPSPSAPTQKAGQRRHSLVNKMQARMERIHITMQQQIMPPPRNDEVGMQMDVGWFQWLSYSVDPSTQPKPLAFPAAEHEPISGFMSIARDLHPFIQRDDPYERATLVRFSYIDRLPCPPPPMYGKELQLRLRRLEVFLREEDFDFLMAFQLVAERLRYKPASPPESGTVSRRLSNASTVDKVDKVEGSGSESHSPTTSSAPTKHLASASTPSLPSQAGAALAPALPARRESQPLPSLPPRPSSSNSTNGKSAADELVKSMLSMGFEQHMCEHALEATKTAAASSKDHLAAAIAWVLDHDDDAVINTNARPSASSEQEQPTSSSPGPDSPKSMAESVKSVNIFEPSVSKSMPGTPEFHAATTPNAIAPGPTAKSLPATPHAAAASSMSFMDDHFSSTAANGKAASDTISIASFDSQSSSVSTTTTQSTLPSAVPVVSSASAQPPADTSEEEEAERALMLLHASTIPFNSYSCMIDVNGPTVHVFPRAFNSPIFTIRLNKIVCAGHSDLSMPIFALHTSGVPSADDPTGKAQKEYFSKGPRPTFFPDIPSDFVGEKIRVGLGKQATKLEIFILPFSMLLLGGLQKDAAVESPNTGGYSATEDKSKPSQVTSGYATPIVKFGETQIGINWDDTASPQLMVSVSTNKIEIPLAQDMLHFLYMIAEEYTVNGMPDFYHSVNQMEGDFQWTDLLKYLPNPTGERLPDRISGFNVIPLLPTYAVGFLWKEYVLSLNQNGVEIARTEVTDSSLVLEHQIRSTHMVVGKFFVRDVKVSAQPRGTVMEHRKDNSGLLLAVRFEDEVREAMNATERRMRLMQQQQQQQQHLQNPGVAVGNAFVSKAVDKLTELEQTSKAALSAEQANKISSTFAWVRDYISEKKMFRKNGLQTRVGLVDLYLNMELFSVLASFFMGDATPVTREHYELLRLSSEASAHAIQQLSMLVDRGRYFTKEEIEKDMQAGLYGVPPHPDPSKRARQQQQQQQQHPHGGLPLPQADAALAALHQALYKLPHKAAPVSNPNPSAHKAALQSLDRLGSMVAVLDDALREMDRQRLAIGNPVSMPVGPPVPGKPVETKLVVPTSTLPDELKRRGNERLQAYWQTLHRAVVDAKEEHDRLKRLVILEWPGQFEAHDDVDEFDDADVPLERALPPVVVLDLPLPNAQNPSAK